jgi:DNA end-binding protein Ku
MKAIWKGYLKCSLVTIPIKMYNAVSRRAIQFHLLHKDCGAKIKQEMVCPRHHRTLAPEEVVKGYQYGKDLHVIITEAELSQAQKESTDTIEILKFVAGDQIHPIYYADAHYLVPDGAAGVEAFALFHQAMGETGQTALAKVILRNREHLLNIRPFKGAFIAFTLHFPEEIQDLNQIEESQELGKVALQPESLEMARTIMAHLSGDFVPEQYMDEYTRTLLSIIRAKAEGKEFKVEPRAEKEKVVSLMEALKRSVEQVEAGAKVARKPMARAGRPRPGARKRQQA